MTVLTCLRFVTKLTASTRDRRTAGSTASTTSTTLDRFASPVNVMSAKDKLNSCIIWTSNSVYLFVNLSIVVILRRTADTYEHFSAESRVGLSHFFTNY